MPYLFAYGTLQEEPLQIVIFGRRLRGTPDAMRGFELVPLEIDDPAVVEISGRARHTMSRHTGRAADVVNGTVFELTDEELDRADDYEVAAVTRISVKLESGLEAWVYIDVASAGSRT